MKWTPKFGDHIIINTGIKSYSCEVHHDLGGAPIVMPIFPNLNDPATDNRFFNISDWHYDLYHSVKARLEKKNDNRTR